MFSVNIHCKLLRHHDLDVMLMCKEKQPKVQYCAKVCVTSEMHKFDFLLSGIWEEILPKKLWNQHVNM